MNDKRIKWGVIGSGGIASRRTIPEGIIPAGNATLHAVFDIDQKTNGESARKYGAKAAGSIRELLASGIDAVYVASPANVHLDHVMACADAGKHVLCEKPLGMNVEEAEKMIAACNKAGIVLGTALMMRFHAQHQEALRMIGEGKIGKPVFGRAQLSCWYPPIDGPGGRIR
jgi:predicted dehydrogenase